MIWLFVGIAVLVLALIVYFLSPFFIKLIKSRKDKPLKQNKKDKSFEKQIKKEEKEKKALEKSQDKQQVEQGVVEVAGDDFFEDPDTKVNYENFDVGGFFENDEMSSFESNKPVFESDDFSDNIDDMFEKYFNNEVRPSDREEYNPFFESGEANEEDLNEFLEQLNSQTGESGSISEDFKNLSPEMKALLISNFLDRKDI